MRVVACKEGKDGFQPHQFLYGNVGSSEVVSMV